MKLATIALASTLVLAACNTAPTDTTTDTTTTPNTATETTGTTNNAAPDTGMEDGAMEPGTIVEVASENGNFTTLVAAVEAAGLTETLSGPGPFTVFAPTDAAFEALPEGTVASLLEQPEELAAILQYHVVSGEVMASDVVTLDSATVLTGDSIPVTVDGSTVMIGDATVVATDVKASNGVIHVIDTVLLPE